MTPAILDLTAPTPAEVMGVRTEVDSLVGEDGWLIYLVGLNIRMKIVKRVLSFGLPKMEKGNGGGWHRNSPWQERNCPPLDQG